MKKLEFKTSKGKFILLDVDTDGLIKLPTDIEYQELGRVKDMTEEQFAEVVEMQRIFNSTNHYCIDDIVYKNYIDYEWMHSPREYFQSLIISIGWYLFENPIKKYRHQYEQMIAKWQYEIDCKEAESKTLYNPILLKKL